MRTSHRLAVRRSIAQSARRRRRTLRDLVQAVARRLSRKYSAALPRALFDRALRDAEELAEQSGFPMLFLPELAEEKVRTVSATAGVLRAAHVSLDARMPNREWRARSCCVPG